jgi:hypothetical protein
MIAQGWGGAAGMAGNIEWQAAIVDAKNCWNMPANPNVDPPRLTTTAY